tara:strand:- start:46 stop:543 length:498 start_codon:yes stop_codon:yes gene_type:complete
MYKYLRLIFFIGYLSAFQFSFTPYPYVSPGIQIGLTGDTKFFFSAQITGGYVPYDNIGAGITIGNRFVRNKGKWIKYTYNDIQISWITGIGFGKLYEEGELKGYKFKTWSIALVGVSYDYIHWKQGKEKPQNELKITSFDNSFSKHNFGLFGVFPLGCCGYESIW